MDPVRVAVVDGHIVFRRGVVACLADDPFLRVMAESSTGPLSAEVDVVVASPDVLSTAFKPPVVVCASNSAALQRPGAVNRIVAVLPRATVTPEQLLAAVRAAAAGLQVNACGPPLATAVDHRGLTVLLLMAEGVETKEISDRIGYSTRTVKEVIRSVEHELGARNRAQAVAEAIRRGLI